MPARKIGACAQRSPPLPAGCVGLRLLLGPFQRGSYAAQLAFSARLRPPFFQACRGHLADDAGPEGAAGRGPPLLPTAFRGSCGPAGPEQLYEVEARGAAL
ncbi:unnamed protein product [Effrenium voratum]|nr:unnamed protein product [Effrenium voratum]